MALLRRWHALCILCLLALSANAQAYHDFGFTRSQDIAVHDAYGQLFLYPWAGGVNGVSAHPIDLDLDGTDDLLLFEKHGNRLLPFLNAGIEGECHYTFAPELSRFFPPLHDWAILRDYDGDDRTDIFTYGNGGITIYRNLSDADGLRFDLVTTQLMSLQYGNLTNLYASPDDYLAIEDIDGDGDLDILNFWLLGKYVHFHRNYSMEEYGDRSHLDFRLEEECWGHFEEGGEDNSILLNSDCGRKGEPLRHVGSTIVARDLTGNGLPDLVLGDIDFPNLVFLENGGTLDDARMVSIDTAFPSAAAPVRLFSMPVLSFVDVDNDGVEELLASPADPVLNKSKDHDCHWLYRFNPATSEYEKQTESFLQGGMIDVGSGAAPVLYDWDRDGLIDLFVGNYGSYDTSAYVNGFVVSEFPSSIAYYRNVGSSTAPAFRLVTADFGGLRQLRMHGLFPAFADLDGNGTTDLLCGTLEGTLLRFSNQSDDPDQPDFAAPDAGFVAHDFGDYATPQFFDLDRDSRPDLVVGNRRGRLAYLRNTGTGDAASFTFVTDTLGGVDVRQPELSYFGFCTPVFFRNAADETVLFCGNEQGGVGYYNHIDGNLNGTFTLQETALLEHAPGWRRAISEGLRSVPAVADLNGDGFPDMLVGNYAGGLSLFLGTTPPPVGIDNPGDILPSLALSIVPNPATDHFAVRLPGSASGTLRIWDATGRLIFLQQFNNQEIIEIKNHQLSAGVYIIQIETVHTLSLPQPSTYAKVVIGGSLK